MPELTDEILYQIMPIAWRCGPEQNEAGAARFGDFAGMLASVSYLRDLGVTMVWMTPIFPSPAYHGYQHGAADGVEPRLGTREQFLSFVRVCHEREIKVLIDFVAYGISVESVYFKDAQGNPASPYDGWLAFTDEGNTQYTGYTYTTWNGASVGLVHWDLRNQAARDVVTAWACGWVAPAEGEAFAVDGFRLDHVWERYLQGPAGADGWGYHIETFWKPWRTALAGARASTVTIAECADWSLWGEALLGAHDAVFAKPWQFAARDALREGRAAPVARATATMLSRIPPGRGVGNSFLATLGDHDVDRLASAIGATSVETLGLLRAAAAVLLLQPFPPVIYMGDELGMMGVGREYGSDANDIPRREPFKWLAREGPPMSAYSKLNERAWNERVSRDDDGRSVEEQWSAAASPVSIHRELVALRKARAALRRGAYRELTTNHPAVWAFARVIADETLVVAINLSGARAYVRVVVGGGGGTVLTPALESDRAGPVRIVGDGVRLDLPAYGFRVLLVPAECAGAGRGCRGRYDRTPERRRSVRRRTRKPH